MADEITYKTCQNPVAIPGPWTAWSACSRSRVLSFSGYRNAHAAAATNGVETVVEKVAISTWDFQAVLISANGHTLPAIVNDEMPDSQPVLASIWINFVELLVVMLHCGNRYQTTVP